MSKDRYQNEKCYDCTPRKDYDYNQHECYKKEPKCQAPKEVILACGRGFDEDRTLVPIADLPTNPIVLARVSIDTSELCKPLVKIDFSTILQVEDGNPPVVLVFALVRTCNGTREIIERYTLNFTGGPPIDEERIFAFTFCDDDFSCHKDCCSYTVELISATLATGVNIEVFENRNTAITAIAQGLCD